MFQQCLNCEENNCLIHLCCVVILCAKQCFHTSSKSSKCAKCAKSLGKFAQARDSPANSYSESEDNGRLNLEVIMVCPRPFLFGYCSFFLSLVLCWSLVDDAQKIQRNAYWAWACVYFSSDILFVIWWVRLAIVFTGICRSVTGWFCLTFHECS